MATRFTHCLSPNMSCRAHFAIGLHCPVAEHSRAIGTLVAVAFATSLKCRALQTRIPIRIHVRAVSAPRANTDETDVTVCTCQTPRSSLIRIRAVRAKHAVEAVR